MTWRYSARLFHNIYLESFKAGAGSSLVEEHKSVYGQGFNSETKVLICEECKIFY